MKQSTFSAVMANSIQKVLQGYTKGIRLVAVLTFLFTVGIGQVWGETATFTEWSYSNGRITGGTLSGAPTGATASLTTTYTNANQMTKSNSQTLTLSGFDGCTITGVTVHVKTNAKSGNGSGTLTINDISKGSLPSTGTIGSSYTNKSFSVTSTVVETGKTIVVTLTASANSFYCDSYTITYDAPTGGNSGNEGDSNCLTLSATNNYPFNSTSSSNTSTYSTEISGVTYESYGGYKYTTNSISYLSFNRSLSGAYIANTTAFSGNIESIVIDYYSGNSSYFTMYEGNSAKPSSTTVTPSSTGTGEVTYTFSGNTTYFKLSLTTTGNYCNIKSITICYSTTPAPSYTITATSNNDSYGTVSLEGTTITASPNSGYRVSTTNPYDVTEGAATVSQSGNTFNVTPSSNCTVRINFEAIPKYTVTLNAGSGTCAASVTETSAGAGVTLPTPTLDCGDWEFAGWAEASVGIETTTKPTLIAAGTYKPASNITLYAVYQRTEGGGGGGEASLTKMVAGNTLSDGDKIVVVANETYTAMYQEIISSSYVNKWDCSTLTADVVADDDKNWWTVTMTTGGFHLGDDTNGYLNMSSNNLYCNTNKSVWTLLDLEDGTFKLQSNERNLSYRSDLTTNPYWRMGGTSYGTAGQTILNLYKYTSGGTTTTYYYSTPDCGDPTYTVSIAANPAAGGSVTINGSAGPIEVTDQDNFTITATPNEGYRFVNWTSNDESNTHYADDDATNSSTTAMVSADVTITANFAKLHTITWNNSGIETPTEYEEGSTLTFPTDPTCEGKTFVGWTTEENKDYFHATTPPLFIDENTKPTTNTTYYAVFATQSGFDGYIDFANKWATTTNMTTSDYSNSSVTLHFESNGGTDPKYYVDGTAVRLYYLNSMTVTAGGNTITKITLYLNEDDNDDLNEIKVGNSIILDKDEFVNSCEWTGNATSVTFTIGERNNSTQTTAGHRKITSIVVEIEGGEAVIYSNYTTSCTTTYKVTYNGNGATSGSVPTDNNNYEENAQVTVLGNTGDLVKTGYEFVGWNTKSDGSGSNYEAGSTFTITKNTTLYAVWKAYTVNWTISPAGSGSLSATTGTSTTVTPDTEYTYASPAYTITAGNATVTQNGNTFTAVPTADCTIQINMVEKPKWTVTFEAGEHGTCGTPSLTETSAGAGVTLPEVTANEGYRFVGWATTSGATTANAGAAGANYKPSGNITLYAVYVKYYTITWLVEGQPYDVGSPTTTVDEGNAISAIPDEPAPLDCAVKFMGWSTQSSGSTPKDPSYYSDLFTTLDEAKVIPIEENTIFHAVFAMTQSGTQSETITTEKSSFTAISGTLDDNISYNSYTGDASDAPALSNGAIRLYQVSSDTKTGGYIVISAATGSITSASITSTETYASSYTGYILDYTKTFTPDKDDFEVNDYTLYKGLTYTVSGLDNSVIAFACFSTNSKYRLEIAKISVTYTKEGAPSYTDYVTSCCETPAPTNGAYENITGSDNAMSVTLTWEGSASRYHITGGNLNAEGEYTDQTSHTISGLTECNEYTFYVSAYPADGCESSAIEIGVKPYIQKKVTFDDGTTTTTQSTSCDSKTVTVPTPTAQNCSTYVWKDKATGTEYTDGQTITPANDMTIVAKWSVETYTITFNDWDGTQLQQSEVNCGVTPTPPDDPTRESDNTYTYTFAGWTPTIVPADGDATYTATYNKTKRTYTVDWYVNGKLVKNETVEAGESATAPDLSKNPCGAVLAGWTDAPNGEYEHETSTLYSGEKPSIEILENKTLYAVFADIDE